MTFWKYQITNNNMLTKIFQVIHNAVDDKLSQVVLIKYCSYMRGVAWVEVSIGVTDCDQVSFSLHFENH